MELQRQAGLMPSGGQPYQAATGSERDPVEKPLTLKEAGIDKHLASRAQKMLPEMRAEAKKRQQEQAKRNQPQSLKVENVPPLEKAKSRDQAAAAVNVSGRTVQDAESVKNPKPQRGLRQQTVNSALQHQLAPKSVDNC